MALINVQKLKKNYQTYKKESGLKGSLKSLFRREHQLIQAVDDISFKIAKGELVGFIGPNGAGKTTTLKCLSGLLYPDSGKVEVLGFNPWDREHKFLKKIALVMGQKNQLWWDLPALETFLLNKEIYEIPDKQFQETLDYLIKTLEVEDIIKVQVRKLSLGQRMKCELIAALIHSPQVLFLDEPTIGLDVVMQKKIRGFIKNYNKKHNSTIILTSHYMSDVKELCQRVIIIDQGKVLFDGQLKEIIDKYADFKIIKTVFNKKIELRELRKLGKVEDYHYPELILKVNKKDSNSVAVRLLKEFPVADLNIEEISIEEIIRRIFNGS